MSRAFPGNASRCVAFPMRCFAMHILCLAHYANPPHCLSLQLLRTACLCITTAVLSMLGFSLAYPFASFPRLAFGVQVNAIPCLCPALISRSSSGSHHSYPRLVYATQIPCVSVQRSTIPLRLCAARFCALTVLTSLCYAPPMQGQAIPTTISLEPRKYSGLCHCSATVRSLGVCRIQGIPAQGRTYLL